MKLPRSLQVDTRIVFRVVASDELSCAKTCAGKAGLWVEPRAYFGRDRSRCGTADDFAFLDQRNGDPISTGELQRTLSDQLEYFIEDKGIFFRFGIARCAAGAYLLVKSGESEKGLKRVKAAAAE